jgi:HSP20 family protein
MSALAPTVREPKALRSGFRFSPLTTVREEMDDLMNRVLGEGEEMWPFGRIAPSLDLAETDRAIEVRLDVPGVDPKDIEVQLNSNLLTVSGHRKEEKEEKGTTYHRVERRSGTFSRSISLPCPVKEEAIVAKYRHGVLAITLPKMEEAKAKKIEIRT